MKGTILNIDKPTRLHLLQRQVARLDIRLARLAALSERYVQARFGLFVALVVLVFLAFSQVNDTAGYTALILSVILFNVVAYFHRRVKRGVQQYQHWRAIKQAHIARIQLDWALIPPADSAAPPEHPFAIDLDLVGERSIHQLLNVAVSHEASQRLLAWLLTTVPAPAQITQRQALVKEMTPLTTFRDKLTLYGWLASGDTGQIEALSLVSWFTRRHEDGPRLVHVLVEWLLAVVNITLLVLDALDVVPPLWIISIVLYIGFWAWKGQGAGDLFAESLALRGAVERLNAVFRYLENYRYGGVPLLRDLCAPFLDPANRPSAQLRRLGWVLAGASLRGNPLLWFLVNLLIPWDFTFAWLLQQRKAEIAAQLPGWLDAWLELEALSSLANFAYLNPEYTFPQLIEDDSFSGQQLGHPLIDYEVKVCNDFSLTQRGEVVIITGSNMAGKSSFLRTLGVNLSLAYAGAPVNATRLETGLFRLFTCIKVSDSVTDGFSYFYAEVRRLKALLVELERDHPYPLFFLIDEIFKGTNNRERLIGSRAYIRALVGRNCLGAVSTHDLELVRLADELPGVRNLHFREEVVDGRMSFDYQLRPGPSPTTNALKIMQLEGLPIEGDSL